MRKIILVVVFIIILILIYYTFNLSNLVKNKSFVFENHDEKILNLSDEEYVDYLLKYHLIDKNKYYNKQICFETKKLGYYCLVPSEFNKNLSKYPDEEKKSLKLLLIKEAKIAENIKMARYDELNEFDKFIEDLRPKFIKDKYFKIKNDLKNNLTWENIKKYYYILSLEWDYLEMKKLEKDLKFNKVKIFLSWKVLDNYWKPIENSIIDIEWKIYKTDINWNYNIEYETLPYKKLRIKAYKPWYSVDVKSFILQSEYITYNFKIDFILNKSNEEIEIDLVNKKIIKWKAKLENDWYLLESSNTTYLLPYNLKFYDANLNVIKPDKLKIYLFEFDRNSNINWLLNSDTFDNYYWYAWEFMITFGMPFIMFFYKDELIYLSKDTPLLVNTCILEYEELEKSFWKDNLDKLYNMTKDIFIDRTYLIKNNFTLFPSWWTFDQFRLIWYEVPFRLKNNKWCIETKYFTVK